MSNSDNSGNRPVPGPEESSGKDPEKNAVLSLRAVDAEDVAILGACLQDALLAVQDMRFLSEENRFVMVANRFCWEKLYRLPAAPQGSGAQPKNSPQPVYERVHCGITIENVHRVQARGFDPADALSRGRLLEVLALAVDDGVVVMHFAGGAALRLEVTETEILLRDLDEPWPTMWRPDHPDQGDSPPEGGNDDGALERGDGTR